MRQRSILLALCCSTIALMAVIAFLEQPHQTTAASSAKATPTEERQITEASAPASITPTPAATFSWRQIESDDYHQYIANLRSIGCPEQTIRDMIVADVNKLYAPRENPLKTKPKQAGDNGTQETPEQKLERLRQLRGVQQEKRWVIKELLGIDLPLDLLPSSGSRDYHPFEVAFRFLPEGKRDGVQVLQETYWQQSDALKAKYNNKRTPEFVAEARQLSDSLRQELGKILTPEELEDYDIRTSAAAKQLSSKLATYFRPTEAEFRQIFRTQRDHEDALQRLPEPAGPAIPPDGVVDKKALAQQRLADRQAVEQLRSAASSQMNEQLKTALGEDRYAEYQRSQDRSYDLLARLGMRYGLPQEKVLEAYELQKSFQPQPAMRGASAAPDKAEVQSQLKEQLTAILGEQAARGYQRVNGGTVPIN